MKIARITDAATEPLSLAEARLFLRVETTADDSMIGDFITAARYRCEQLADRSFIATTWRMTLDFLPFASNPLVGFPFPIGQHGGGFNRVDRDDGAIFLPFPPLIAISSFTYISPSGVATSIDVTPGAGNVIVSDGTPGKIYPAYGKFYPIGLPAPQSVAITYASGYGPDYASVPKNIMAAMRFLLGFMYEHRSENAETPQIVEDMLSPSDWGGYA